MKSLRKSLPAFVALTLATCFTARLRSQNPTATAASALATRALAALTGGNPVVSVALRGDAVWTVGGDDESGTVTLVASGSASSRVALHLNGGTLTEVRDTDHGHPQGASQATSTPGADGAVHKRSLDNGWTPAVWFFPALGPLSTAAAPDVRVVDLGPTSIGGLTLDHLEVERTFPNVNPKVRTELTSLSRADIYLDPNTLLPALMRWERHPAHNLNRDVPIEARYADYRPMSGLTVPTHIERWVNGSRQLSVTVTAVDLDPAEDAAQFMLAGAQ